MYRRQHFYQLVLQIVGILILVHHDISEARSVVFEYVRVLLQKLHSVPQKVIKVHGVCSHQLVRIAAVYLIDLLLVREPASVSQKVFRTLFTLLALAYDRDDHRRRSRLIVDLELLAYPLHKGLLVSLVIDRKARLIAQSFRRVSEHAKAHGMESHDPHAISFTHQAFHPASHLTGRLICECNGQYAAWIYALIYHVRHAVSHCRGLAGTRSREYQYRPVQMPHSLILFTVQCNAHRCLIIPFFA